MITNIIQNAAIFVLAWGLVFAGLAIGNLSKTLRLVQGNRHPEGESDS